MKRFITAFMALALICAFTTAPAFAEGEKITAQDVINKIDYFGKKWWIGSSTTYYDLKNNNLIEYRFCRNMLEFDLQNRKATPPLQDVIDVTIEKTAEEKGEIYQIYNAWFKDNFENYAEEMYPAFMKVLWSYPGKLYNKNQCGYTKKGSKELLFAEPHHRAGKLFLNLVNVVGSKMQREAKQ